MQLYKRDNAWLTAEQLIEHNKKLGSVSSEEKDEDKLVVEEVEVAENASQGLEGAMDSIPTNFMQLKKYAKEKGVDVSIYKTKEEILKELNK